MTIMRRDGVCRETDRQSSLVLGTWIHPATCDGWQALPNFLLVLLFLLPHCMFVPFIPVPDIWISEVRRDPYLRETLSISASMDSKRTAPWFVRSPTTTTTPPPRLYTNFHHYQFAAPVSDRTGSKIKIRS
ncbi:hypothetical protein CC78DRAFT_615563 [Lojkania enalia]|uniref:Uncharacterized protein n=1 Tax=Lojkania enalia TaxID=147567 RepID=A0A9P4KAI9_9PLEO|nr:hypothetical protein CC78DRAFT_615563 [Didymosphaeria enalia]